MSCEERRAKCKIDCKESNKSETSASYRQCNTNCGKVLEQCQGRRNEEEKKRKDANTFAQFNDVHRQMQAVFAQYAALYGK